MRAELESELQQKDRQIKLLQQALQVGGGFVSRSSRRIPELSKQE